LELDTDYIRDGRSIRIFLWFEYFSVYKSFGFQYLGTFCGIRKKESSYITDDCVLHLRLLSFWISSIV